MKARCARVITEKAARFFSLRPLLSPGGYLLSRDLSSDYHRRADVSLPGSEWDRVGPSGYDHQAAASQVSLSISVPVCHVLLCSVLWLYQRAG